MAQWSAIYQALTRAETDQKRLSRANRIALADIFKSHGCRRMAKMIQQPKNDETWSGLWLMTLIILRTTPNASLERTEQNWIGLLRMFKPQVRYLFAQLGHEHEWVKTISATPGVTMWTEEIAARIVAGFARTHFAAWVDRKTKEHPGPLHFTEIPKTWAGFEMLFTLYWYADSKERVFVNKAMSLIDNAVFSNMSFGGHLLHLSVTRYESRGWVKWEKWWKSRVS